MAACSAVMSPSAGINTRQREVLFLSIDLVATLFHLATYLLCMMPLLAGVRAAQAGSKTGSKIVLFTFPFLFIVLVCFLIWEHQGRSQWRHPSRGVDHILFREPPPSVFLPIVKTPARKVNNLQTRIRRDMCGPQHRPSIPRSGLDPPLAEELGLQRRRLRSK